MGRLVVRADRSDDPDVRKRFVTEGLECGIDRFVIRKGDDALLKLGRFDAMFSVDGKIIDGSFETVDIVNPDSQEHAMSLAGRKNVIAFTMDWKVIPVENLISRFRGSGTELYVVACDVDDAKLFLTTMETGADNVIVDVGEPSEIKGFSELTQIGKKLELTAVRITSVRPVEMGDRVCIDTCVSMSPGEGMLVGSQSGCLFLVQSECESSGYVASRPFRVNAGAVHSYIQSSGDRTRYLSEISGGESVLICDSAGNTRVATVGRCKIEKRPLLMVAATDGGKEYSVILQNAETVRLVTPDGSASVTELKKGDEVLAKLSSGGRHFGMRVDESVSEI